MAQPKVIVLAVIVIVAVAIVGTYYAVSPAAPVTPGVTTLSVDTTPVKGGVTVDGVSWGTAPVSREVDPGTYTVTFGAVTGYTAPASQSVTVASGETRSITVTYVALEPEKFKVALVLPSPIGDYGWNYAAYQSVMRLEDELPYVEVIGFSESVAEPDVEPYLRDYCEMGADLIIAHSYGYYDFCMTVSEDYPDVVFIYPGGTEDMIGPRVATVYCKGPEGEYLIGMLAGLMTQTNGIGYVGSFPTPMLVWEINAYFLGANSVNPNVENYIAFTGSWYDPAREKETAYALMDVGADFLCHACDSQAPAEAAADRGVHAFGQFTDVVAAGYSEDAVPTSILWKWDPFFRETIEKIRAGTWETGWYYPGLAEGCIDLAPFSPWVPEDVRTIINQKKQEIIDGTFIVPLDSTVWWT